MSFAKLLPESRKRVLKELEEAGHTQECKKASDLDRDLHQFDFIIILNRETWEAFSEEQRAALLDHELCHAEVKYNDGQVEFDDRGRIVYRIRKHDIEEFSEVVSRNGIWKNDLIAFAEAMADQQEELFLDGTSLKDTPVTIESGDQKIETTVGKMREVGRKARSAAR